MIDPKSTFIDFEKNKMLEIIFHDITNLVKKIRKSKNKYSSSSRNEYIKYWNYGAVYQFNKPYDR